MGHYRIEMYLKSEHFLTKIVAPDFIARGLSWQVK